MQELGREAGRYTRASRPLLRLFVSVMMIDRDDWSPRFGYSPHRVARKCRHRQYGVDIDPGGGFQQETGEAETLEKVTRVATSAVLSWQRQHFICLATSAYIIITICKHVCLQYSVVDRFVCL